MFNMVEPAFVLPLNIMKKGEMTAIAKLPFNDLIVCLTAFKRAKGSFSAYFFMFIVPLLLIAFLKK